MPVKNVLFLFFPPELSGQPAFKFDKDMDVRRIFRMIQRTLAFVGWVHFFWYPPLQSVAFQPLL
jgi:hypothetical protein